VLCVSPSFILCLLASVFCLLVLTSQLVQSQSSNGNKNSKAQPVSLHQWGAVTLFHGLPSDRVHAIAQDGDGAMWFGTDAGLAKYDGRRTQTITSAGLPQGRVLALKVDLEGALWVGTEGGASRYVNNQFRLVKETEGKAITAIIVAEKGRAILASEEGSIFVCLHNAEGAIAVRTIPGEPLRSADETRPGPLRITSLALAGNNLYAGTLSRGLFAIEGDAANEVPSKPHPFFIEAIEGDLHGHLWLGARMKGEEGGLYDASDPLRPKLLDGGTGVVTALRADARGRLWVGTDGRGVFQYRGAQRIARFTFEGTAGGLRSDHVYSVFVDREEVVWFGTDRGVCRYDPYALRVETISDNPESNFVRVLLQTTDGRLLAGTNRGLFVRDGAAASWQSVSELAQKTVYTIAADESGRLLVGSASGLYLSDEPVDEKNRVLHFTRQDAHNDEKDAGDSVRATARFQNQTYVATFQRGFELLKDGGRALVWPTDPRDARAREVVSLYAEGDARLWIGTATSGVYLFDGKTVKSDPAFGELAGSAVWSVDGTGDGWLWLATSRGLYSYWQGKLTKVLPDIEARRVMVSGDRASSRQAWCATAGSGLIKVSLDERFGAMIARLDQEQGLPSQHAFAILPDRTGATEGALLIGTNRGLARYDPGRASPILTITRLIGQRIHTLDELRSGLNLEYPQNSLVLDVAATSSRTFPEQFQYAFLLYNQQGELVKQKLAHDAQFSMEDLRPGKYRVEVRAYTADLIASDPLAFEFTVAKTPFPWTTAALSALLLLALVALIWAIIEHRRIAQTSLALALANHELADARLRLANEAEMERSRIARDLHDQTLADLRRLLLLTDQLPAEGKNGNSAALDPAVFRHEIESVSNEIRRICEDLSPSVLENVGLAAALEWAIADAVAHLPESCKFEYEFACEEDLEERIKLAPGVRMQIYRITQEAISNICRHAAAHRVRLAVSLTTEDELLLTLTDDGNGFDPRDKKAGKGRGLANIRARASLIEADASWSRNPRGGTVFSLRKANVASKLDQSV
jgi:ligand-binding sensor domain-containing protein